MCIVRSTLSYSQQYFQKTQLSLYRTERECIVKINLQFSRLSVIAFYYNHIILFCILFFSCRDIKIPLLTNLNLNKFKTIQFFICDYVSSFSKSGLFSFVRFSVFRKLNQNFFNVKQLRIQRIIQTMQSKTNTFFLRKTYSLTISIFLIVWKNMCVL